MWARTVVGFSILCIAVLDDVSAKADVLGGSCGAKEQALRNAGFGHAPNGLPIGTVGSGPGSPEEPWCTVNCARPSLSFRPLQRSRGHRTFRRWR